mgnify:FL=1
MGARGRGPLATPGPLDYETDKGAGESARPMHRIFTMARRKKIDEGKAKILYEGPEPGTIVQYFKDAVGFCKL